MVEAINPVNSANAYPTNGPTVQDEITAMTNELAVEKNKIAEDTAQIAHSQNEIAALQQQLAGTSDPIEKGLIQRAINLCNEMLTDANNQLNEDAVPARKTATVLYLAQNTPNLTMAQLEAFASEYQYTLPIHPQ